MSDAGLPNERVENTDVCEDLTIHFWPRWSSSTKQGSVFSLDLVHNEVCNASILDPVSKPSTTGSQPSA